MSVEMKTREEVAAQIGARLREVRQARRYSQEKLGRLTDLSRETIRKVEAGETLPELLTLDVMAQALEVPLTMLLPEGSDKRALFNAWDLALEQIAV
jgi:transcriptional regulator with XRE-family HTH domain